MNNEYSVNDEFRDLARYFRLSLLRERGVLPPVGLKEIENIVSRCERAASIEEKRKRLLEDDIDVEEYETEVAEQRAALAEAIKGGIIGRKNTDVEDNNNEIGMAEEFKDLARYFRLSILRNNGQLPPSGLEELQELVERCDRARILENKREQLINGDIDEKEYQEIHDYHRAALADEVKRVARGKQENFNREEAPKEEPQHLNVIREDYKDLARYFRLSMLRDQKVLPPVGLQELGEIASRNEMANRVEKAKVELKAGKITEEEYQKIHDEERAALADEIKRVAALNAEGKGLAEEPKIDGGKILINPVPEEPKKEEEKVLINPVPDEPKKEEEKPDLERYRIALRTLKAYKEYNDGMQKLGFNNFDELTSFLGLNKPDPSKTR